MWTTYADNEERASSIVTLDNLPIALAYQVATPSPATKRRRKEDDLEEI